MNVLLTGEVQVGKSTIVQRILKEFHGSLGGFRTVFGPLEPDRGSDVYLIRTDEDKEAGWREENLVAHRIGVKSFESYPDAFDRLGPPLLEAAKSKDLILIDELGFLENDAHAFQRAVLEALHSKVPVLAVVKPLDTPFLSQVRTCADTVVLTVTEENRERVFEEARDYVLQPQYA